MPETTESKIPKPMLDQYWEPIYVLTGIFGVFFFMGLFLVPRGPNAEVIRTCISVSAFSMWLFWVTVYIAQMNPVLGPKMENTTLAWMSKKWGLDMQADTVLAKARAMSNIGAPGT